MSDLEAIRKQIDGIDQAILKALASRRELATAILQAKDEAGRELRDSDREGELLEQVIARGRELGLDSHFVTRVFHEVIDDSIRSQQLVLLDGGKSTAGHKVAFQGLDGAYSQLAAQRYFAPRGEDNELIGYPTFEQAVLAVEAGEVESAVLPVENTTAGNVTEVYDMLALHRLHVIGEEIFRVEHCLLGTEEVPLNELRRISSHPLALSQCNKFLSSLRRCERGYLTDTATAVKVVKEEGDPTHAAIASQEAAEQFGLKILKRRIADQKDNFTRFLVVAKEPIQVDLRVHAKTSLILATPHTKGSLLRVLEAFDKHDVNLTKLDSRPRPDEPFQYLFYLDIEGNQEADNVREALDSVRAGTTFLKVLGTYAAHGRKRTQPPIAAIVPPRQDQASGPSAVAGSPEPAQQPAAAPAAKAPAKAKNKKKVSYKLASREARSEDTIIEVRGVRIGGDSFVTIAGPCSVESREQIMTCARQVKECGGQIIRGGCFKPRTSPYSFQGLGYEGLDLLVEAGRAYDLPTITEVLSPVDVQKVAETADILQIGARNMQNFSLLNEVGRVNRPVLLKRGMMSTIDEFLNAAEYLLSQGNHQVILCERGIRTFETAVRNTLDLASIPLLKELTHLPIVVDPSHAAGKRDLVRPLALASYGVRPHGIMVEIHPEPEKAKSDGPQALRFPAFAELMQTFHGK